MGLEAADRVALVWHGGELIPSDVPSVQSHNQVRFAFVICTSKSTAFRVTRPHLLVKLQINFSFSSINSTPQSSLSYQTSTNLRIRNHVELVQQGEGIRSRQT